MSAESIAVLEGEHYILAQEVPVPERTYVLKQDDTFGLFNDFGDIVAGARHEEGLYHEGTRFLSLFALRLAGARPLLLSSAVRRDNLMLSVDLTNPDIDLGKGQILPRGSLHIYRSKLIWHGACHERIHVRNFTLTTLNISLALEFAADYADIFEVRGQHRQRRGYLREPHVGKDSRRSSTKASTAFCDAPACSVSRLRRASRGANCACERNWTLIVSRCSRS